MRHMGKAVIAFSLAGLVAPLLSACNTTDALTPQVDVGAGTQPGGSTGYNQDRRYAGETRPVSRGYRATSPVTQADSDDIARAPQSETYRDRTYAQHPPIRQGSPYPSGNSLEAQADALQSGSSVSPASSGPPPVWSGQDDAAGLARSSHADTPQTRQAPPMALASQQAPSSVPAAGRQHGPLLPVIARRSRR